MKFGRQSGRRILLILFLCLELMVLHTGGRAFYSTPVDRSIAEGAPESDRLHVLPPHGWSTQEQWFKAEGNYCNRIAFHVASETDPAEGNIGGITVRLKAEDGTILAEQHYTGDDCLAGTLSLELQKTVKNGGRYCFEAIADPAQPGWAVPYLYVPGGELSSWEDASLDGQPMGGSRYYLFLSFFFSQFNAAAAALHMIAAIAAVGYLVLFWNQEKSGFSAADAAALCVAIVCGAGQFWLCNQYFFSRTLVLCVPCAFFAAMPFCRLFKEFLGELFDRLLEAAGKLFLPLKKAFFKHSRLRVRSWKTWAFLGCMLLLCVLIALGIKEYGGFSVGYSFFVAVAAFWACMFFGTFRLSWLERIAARFPWGIYGIVSALIFVQMEISNANPFTEMTWGFAVWNIITIAVFLAVLWALLGNIRVAGMAGAAFFAAWGIANYLTVDFRGIPIAPSDLMSARTALNVLGGYQITPRMELTAILLLIFLEFLLLMRIPLKKAGGKRIWQRGTVFVCSAVFFWQGYFGGLNPLNMTSLGWVWREIYHPQGYTAVSLARIQQLIVRAPAGYSEDAVRAMYQAEQEQTVNDAPMPDTYPNIIFIVNESWFDWRQVTDFTTDRPVTPFIDSLENCVRGFTTSPNSGGCTSLSEYELLTSNSLSMMPELTPFTQRNLEGSYSIVSYLEDLGYTSTAMHPGYEISYNRKIAYPQLGFDETIFDEDARFVDMKWIRYFVIDDTVFKTIESLYEKKEADRPAFLYALTIQNHGGYLLTEMNGGQYMLAEENTVQVTSGFDGYQNEAAEYLSLLTYTDDAFEGLIRYFEGVEEPTIICMVGDHSPYFSGDTTQREDSDVEAHFRIRGTPFVIWANYPIEAYDAGYIGMVQLMPLLLKTAEMPLSPYYQTILELSEEYPVLNGAFYQTADGSFGEYSYLDVIPENELLKRYFYYEYNSLTPEKKRIPELFLAG